MTPEMVALVEDLQKKVVVGLIGGSDLKKIQEQMATMGDSKGHSMLEVN